MKKKIKVKTSRVEVKTYNKDSIEDLIEIYINWEEGRRIAKKNDGRCPNIPEIITEGLVAYLIPETSRKIKVLSKGSEKTSWDCIDEKNDLTIQVKATSSTGPTSFGPKSEANKLLLVDFYNDNNINGSFKIYDASDIDIDNLNVNKRETVKNQKDAGKRPRLSLLKVVDKANLTPIIEGNIKDIKNLKKKFATLSLEDDEE